MTTQTRRGRLIPGGRSLLVSALFAAAPLSCQVISGLDGLDARDTSGSSSSSSGPCQQGAMQACYSGPPGTEGAGICKSGAQTCEASGSWSPCVGDVTPQPIEDCAVGVDATCDGAPPEPCTGAPQQAFSFGGTMGDDYGHAVAIDSKGNAIFVGTYNGAATVGGISLESPANASFNLFVVKVDPSGSVLWARGFGGDGIDIAIAVAIGKDDTILLTGTFAATLIIGQDVLTSKGEGDIFLAKLDANGDPVWAKGFGGTGNEQGLAVTTDDQGNVVLTGYCTGPVEFGGLALNGPLNAIQDGFVVKTNPDGAPQWAVAVAGSGVEEALSVMTDGAGDIVVGGRGSGDVTIAGVKTPSTSGNSALLFKLGAGGELLWSKVFGPPTVDPNQAIYDVARGGNDGEILIAGHFQTQLDIPPNGSLFGTDGLDAFVAKLNKDGGAIWIKSMGGPMNDVAYEVGVDSFGNVLVGGFFSMGLNFDTKMLVATGPADGFVARLSPEGLLLWAEALGGTGSDIVYGVASAPDGASFITGVFDGSMTLDKTMLISGGLGDVFFARLAP